jgi:multiple sugar transport system permease protein
MALPLTTRASSRGHKPRGGAPRRSPAGSGVPVGSWRGWSWARRLLALLIALLFLVPFYWVFVISLQKGTTISSWPLDLVPQWHWANYSRAWDLTTWPRYFLNTVFIAAATVLLCLVTSVLAGFAFGVLRFPGRKILMGVILAVLMVPTVTLIVPDFVIANELHLLNTYWIQIIPFGSSVFGIFLVRQFFLTMPQEIMDAAAVDGAGRLRILWHIGVPAVRPALLLIGINVFVTSWNSFLWPQIMVSNPSYQPIEVGLASFTTDNGTDWSAMSAAVCFTTLPIMLLFLLLQRQFMRGAMTAAGSVK